MSISDGMTSDLVQHISDTQVLAERESQLYKELDSLYRNNRNNYLKLGESLLKRLVDEAAQDYCTIYGEPGTPVRLMFTTNELMFVTNKLLSEHQWRIQAWLDIERENSCGFDEDYSQDWSEQDYY